MADPGVGRQDSMLSSRSAGDWEVLMAGDGDMEEGEHTPRSALAKHDEEVEARGSGIHQSSSHAATTLHQRHASSSPSSPASPASPSRHTHTRMSSSQPHSPTHTLSRAPSCAFPTVHVVISPSQRTATGSCSSLNDQSVRLFLRVTSPPPSPPHHQCRHHHGSSPFLSSHLSPNGARTPSRASSHYSTGSAVIIAALEAELRQQRARADLAEQALAAERAKHLSDLPASTTATPSAPPAASPTAPTQTLLCGVHTAQPLPEHVSTTVLSTHAPSSSASSVASVASMTRGEGKLSAMLLVTPAHLAAQLPEAEAEAGAETGAGRAGPSQPDTPDAVLVTSRAGSSRGEDGETQSECSSELLSLEPGHGVLVLWWRAGGWRTATVTLVGAAVVAASAYGTLSFCSALRALACKMAMRHPLKSPFPAAAATATHYSGVRRVFVAGPAVLPPTHVPVLRGPQEVPPATLGSPNSSIDGSFGCNADMHGGSGGAGVAVAPPVAAAMAVCPAMGLPGLVLGPVAGLLTYL